MANEEGSTTSSSESVGNLDDFVVQDEYLDDDLEPELLNPVPARSESDNGSSNPFSDSELDPDNYLLDPEGLNLIYPIEDNNGSTYLFPDSELDPDNYLLDPEGQNLINPAEDSNDSELENYLLGPDGVYLENQGWSESNSDNESVPELDPELPAGPGDPG